MEKHHGQIVERVVRNKGFNITALAKGLSISRRSLYNRFQSDNIKRDIIYAIGVIIRHDFSKEFPELFDEEQMIVEENPDDYAEDAESNQSYKEKYLNLLESYNDLLIDAIKKSDADLKAPEDPESI